MPSSDLKSLFGSPSTAPSSLLTASPTKPIPKATAIAIPTSLGAPKVYSREDYPTTKRKSEKDKSAKGERYIEDGKQMVKGGKKRARKAAEAQDAAEGIVTEKDAEEDAETTATAEATTATTTTKQTAAHDSVTLFVSNLPGATDAKGLKKLFKQFGPIETTRIRATPQAAEGYKLPPGQEGNLSLQKKVNAIRTSDKEKTVVSVVGFVVFDKEEGVIKAVKECEETPIVVGGRTLKVDRVGEFASSHDAGNSVFVGNLPFLSDEETLKKHFEEGLEGEHKVTRVRIVRDKDTRKCIGIGYLLMEDKQGVAAVLSKGGEGFNSYMKKTLRVDVCGARTKGRKGGALAGGKVPEWMGRTVHGAGRRVLSTGKKKGVIKSDAKFPPKKKAKKVESAAPKVSAKVSKRAASEKKTNDRVRKIEGRIKKGMGAQKTSKGGGGKGRS